MLLKRALHRDNKSVMGSRTKNKKSRALMLSAVAIEALKERTQVVLSRWLSASTWTYYDLVFPSRAGTILDPSNFRNQLNKARAKVNREADKSEDSYAVRWEMGSFHALWHYFASIGMTAAESAQGQQFFGHTTRRMTTTAGGESDFVMRLRSALRSNELRGHDGLHESAPGGTRTPNRPGRNRLLYPLSYGRMP